MANANAEKWDKPTDTGFRTLDQPALHHRPMKVILIGVGLTGMHAIARFKQYGPGIDLVCYEANPDVGGTWYSNKYPGVAVDSPSNGSDCLKYCNHLSDIVGAKECTRFNCRIEHVEWDESKAVWNLRIRDSTTGKVFEDQAPIIINSSGILSQPKVPNLPGMNDFKGKILHTARYDPKIPIDGKRVALVGAGSTSIQVLPQIRGRCEKVDVYIRSSTWVIPMFAGGIRDEFFGFDNSDQFYADDAARINPYYTDEHRKMWKDKPETLCKHRKDIMTDLNKFFDDGFTISGSDIAEAFRNEVIKGTKIKLSRKPELVDLFTPEWYPGCRRATPGVEYHMALQEDNVEVFRRGIEGFTETGLIDSNGEKRDYDVIIFATGFRTDFNPPWTTKGRDGYSLNSEAYLENPKSYMVVHAPKHPNYFSIAGPALMAFNGDFLPGQERLMDNIIKTIFKMQRERIKTIEAKPDAINAFMQFVDEYLKRTVHTQSCSSWYKGGKKDGRIRAIWPGSTLHMIELINNPKWEDFNYTYMDRQDTADRFLYFGNGHSHWDMTEDRCPYITTVENPEKAVERCDPNRLVDMATFRY